MILSIVVPFLIGAIAEKIIRLLYWIIVFLIGFIIFQLINKAFNPGETLRWSIGICLTVFAVVIAFAYVDAVVARLDLSRKERPRNSLSITPYLNYLVILIICGAIVGGYFGFYSMGRSTAQKRVTFYLVKQSGGGKEDSELVFLGTYGDYLVVVPFHRDTKKFESFVIFKMHQAENTRLTFTPEQVGPLQPVEGKPAEAKP